MSAYSRVVYKGKYVSAIDKEILEALDKIMGYGGDLTLTQGGYNRGGVKASAGTHDGGGAFDLTFNDAARKVWVLRLLGVAAWRRFRPTFTSDHVHGIVLDNSAASNGAKVQMHAYLNGRNGLANNAADGDKRPVVIPRFVYGATKGRWVAKRNTAGYSQPYASAKYKKVDRKKGYEWKTKNVATVKAGGKVWLVTENLTFYLKSDFEPLLNIKKTVDKGVYTVTADPALYGLAAPGSGNTKKTSVKKGGKVTGAYRTRLSNGEVWIQNISGYWFSAKYLKAREAVKPAPKPTTKAAVIRPMTYNIPDKEKLSNATEDVRAKNGAALIVGKAPSVVGFNELVGPGKDSESNKPSAFAAKIAKNLGADYGFITPTTAYNENYLAYNKKKTELVKAYPDTKIYAKTGNTAVPGRHVTRAVFKDKASGLVYAVGQTHLASNKEATDAGRNAQAVLIMAAMKEVSSKHGNCPIIIMGDMNQGSDLKGFIDGGLKNVRKSAKKTTNGKFSTYANIKDTTPNQDPAWIIDHIYAPKSWTVNGYTVVLEGTTTKFKSPRSSDHVPVITAVTNA